MLAVSAGGESAHVAVAIQAYWVATSPNLNQYRYGSAHHALLMQAMAGDLRRPTRLPVGRVCFAVDHPTLSYVGGKVPIVEVVPSSKVLPAKVATNVASGVALAEGETRQLA